MAFDPDAYLKKLDTGGFDPDAYLSKQEAPASALGSGVRKAVQGVTAGFSDEIAGGVEAAGRAVGIEGLGGPMKDIKAADDGPTLDWEVIKTAYKRARDKERETLKKDSKDNPGVAAAAEFAGALVSPVNKIAKGASLAKQGAAIGAVTGLGNSKAEDVGGMALDTAIGGALGGSIGKAADKVAPLVDKGVQKLGDKTREFAEKFAARALGAERGSIKKFGQDRVQAAGRQALDEGVLSPLASTDDLIARNDAVKKAGGEMMNKAYSAVDDAGASTFNPLEVAAKVDSELGDFWRSSLNKAEAKQFDNVLEAIYERGQTDIPLKQAQILKEEIKKVAKFDKNKSLEVSDKEQMARDAYRIVSKSIDDAVERGGKVIEAAGLKEVLGRGKQLYGNAKTTGKLLGDKQAREQGNKFISLTDTIAGGAGLGYGGMTGDWETAVGIVAGKKILQKYGAQNAAIGLDKLSKVLMKSPNVAQLAKSNPNAYMDLLRKTAGQNGALEKFIPKTADSSPSEQPERAPSGKGPISPDEMEKPLKGEAKWARDGLKKLMAHDKSGGADFEKLLETKEGKRLLIAASDLNVGSKAMDKLFAKAKGKP